MVKLTLKEQVYEAISEVMLEDKRWMGIEDYDKLDDFGIDDITVFDLALQLESIFPFFACTVGEIESWVYVKDVFCTVEIQEREKGA